MTDQRNQRQLLIHFTRYVSTITILSGSAAQPRMTTAEQAALLGAVGDETLDPGRMPLTEKPQGNFTDTVVVRRRTVVPSRRR